jgi:hypothetical protein
MNAAISSIASSHTPAPIRILGVPTADNLQPQVRRRPGTRPAGTSRSSTRPPNRAPESAEPPIKIIKVGSTDVEAAPRFSPRANDQEEPLGDPTQLGAAVVRAAVEVLDGQRPLSQIKSWVTPEVALQIAQRAKLELAIPGRGSGAAQIRIRKVHLVRFDDAAELTVLLEGAGRVRAAAARMEARLGTWRVSVLEIA